MLPLMLDAVNRRRLNLNRLVALMAENPASIFGIQGKGSISVGYDADLVVVDMRLRKRVRDDALFTKCGWSPYHGKKLKGWPVTTIVNGSVVFDSGQIIGERTGREVQYRAI